MTSLAHSPSTFERRQLDPMGMLALAREQLRLVPSGDGWSLIRRDGKLVFHGLGITGRQRCLEYARDHGVLAVTS